MALWPGLVHLALLNLVCRLFPIRVARGPLRKSIRDPVGEALEIPESTTVL